MVRVLLGFDASFREFVLAETLHPHVIVLAGRAIAAVAGAALQLPPITVGLVALALLVPSATAALTVLPERAGSSEWCRRQIEFAVATAGPSHSVVAYSFPHEIRVFDSANPWRDLGLSAPTDVELVDSVRARLATTGRWLPATSLESLLESELTLAALQNAFAERRVDRVVVSIPAAWARDLDRTLVAREPSEESHCAYRKDAFACLATFPVVDTLLSADHVQMVCTLEVPRAPESRR